MNPKPNVDQELSSNLEWYRCLVGKMILSLLNKILMFAINVVSQNMAKPSLPQREVVLWIVRYLQVHPGHLLLEASNSHLCVNSFTDSDLAGSPFDRISTIG